MSSLGSPQSQRTPWTIVLGCLVACLLLLTLALVLIYFIAQANEPSGLPLIAIELVGTATPYPTRTPYVTATPYFTVTPNKTPTPYKTQTPYPTVAPYPTTGGLGQRQLMLILGGCQLKVENQYTIQDAVIILANVDTNAIAAAVYVRARDSFTHGGIGVGTYYTYVALGQDWDNVSGRFKNNAAYLRFEERNTFTKCGLSIYQGYQNLTVTLNTNPGSGTSTISVPANSFPSIAPNSFPGIAP